MVKSPLTPRPHSSHYPQFAVPSQTRKRSFSGIFPDIAQFNNHNLLSELAIFAAKNKDVDYLNATIRNCLPGELFSFKSVTIINQDDVATIPQNFRIQWICLGSHLTFTIKSRISRNHAA